MQLIAALEQEPGLALQARVLHRLAVRAVIPRDRQLLMVHSSVGGEFKFPGGGVHSGEDPRAALRREVLEECGRELWQLGAGLGLVVEHRRATEAHLDVLRMESRYYWCQVGRDVVDLVLDDYEHDLGFHPEWVDVGDAISVNESLLRSGRAAAWVQRDTLVLGLVATQLPHEQWGCR